MKKIIDLNSFIVMNRFHLFLCVFLFFFSFLSAQLYISPGTEFKIEDNTILTVKQSSEEKKDSDQTTIYIASDVLVTNAEQFHIIKAEPKENPNILSEEKKPAQSPTRTITQEIKPEADEEQFPKKQLVFKSCPSKNNSYLTLNYQKKLVVLSNNYTTKIFVVLPLKNYVLQIKKSEKILEYKTTDIFFRNRSFSKQNFTRPPPFT